MLPNELYCIIFSFLPTSDIVWVIPRVCKHWKNIFESAPRELANVLNPVIQDSAELAYLEPDFLFLQSLSNYNIRYEPHMLYASCESGDLETVKWIISRFNLSPEDVRANGNSAFLRSCENGHLELAQWLVSHTNLTAHNACANEALRYSCANGHLEVAQWLATKFELTPDDARTADNDALRWSCANGHLELVQWLATHFHLAPEDARDEDNAAVVVQMVT